MKNPQLLQFLNFVRLGRRQLNIDWRWHYLRNCSNCGFFIHGPSTLHRKRNLSNILLTNCTQNDFMPRMAQKQVRLEDETYKQLVKAKRGFWTKISLASLANSAMRVGLKHLVIETQLTKGK